MILCRECKNWQTTEFYDSLEGAAAAWNNQPLVNRLRAEIAALTDERDQRQRIIALAGGHAIEEMAAGINALTAERDELKEICDGMERGVIELAGENVKLSAMQAKRRQPVKNGYVYRCQCINCKHPDAWHWELYVNRWSIGICDPQDEDNDRHVDLPDHLRLCELVNSEPDGDA